MASNVRTALRQLVRTPGFTLAVLAMLCLGIGANTAIFTVVNTVLLHPLPYAHSDRIVNIARQGGGPVSVPMFTFWQQNNTGLEDLSGYEAPALSTLDGSDRPLSIESTKVSGNYFKLFGAIPILGRAFSQMEDRPGGANVAVISHNLWQRRFNSDPAIVGEAITLEGISYTVVGVLPPTFHAYPSADVWTALQADVNSTDLAGILTVAGRLPAGDTISAAIARMDVIAKQYVHSDARQLGTEGRLEVISMHQKVTGDVRPRLLILLGAVGLVLLIACANVANLFLARVVARQRELAIRVAIGASRRHIVQELLTESSILALGGGGLGLILGSWAVRALVALSPGELPRIQEMAAVPALDPWIAGFALLLSITTGIVFGLFPALRLPLFINPKTLLNRNRPQAVLIAAELAIAVVLLCSALLLIRSFAALHTIALGFDPQNLLTMQVPLRGPSYSQSSDVDRFSRQVVERIEGIPGIESVAVVSAVPLFGQMDMVFSIPGQPLPEGRKFTGDVQWRFVSPNYFEVLKTPLRSGRFMTNQERAPTVVINQAMARRFWPNSNPVGTTIFIGPGLGPDFEQGVTEIVGVVADERVRLNEDSVPIMYQLPAQISDAALKLMNKLQPVAVIVRTRQGVAPLSISQTVAQEVSSVAKQPVGNIRTIDQARLDSTARENFNMTLLVLFAAIGTLLAAVGAYGVTAYNVEQRIQEIGIRGALGANRRMIRNFILVQALRMSLMGGAIGIVTSFGLMPLLRAQLFGVMPSDPMSFAVAVLILLMVTITAAYIPAERASRVDPIVSLRHD
jgi:putative ABC transport system permease protein